MKQYFKKYKWTEEYILVQIEKVLRKNLNADFKICVGHHPIADLCGR